MGKLFAVLLLATYAMAQIRVAIAANMSYAMPELLQAFHQRYPQIQVQTIIGSSGKLATQILHGAKYDLYLSADGSYPARLYHEGKSATRPITYALGSLVLVTRRPIADIHDLANLKRIAIANPKTAPYGAAAKELLQRLGLWKRLQDRLVYGESIAQTLHYALRGGVDGAIVARSAIAAHSIPLHVMPLDPTLHSPIQQKMVLLKPSGPGALLFTFLLSPEAEGILRRYGYEVPQ
ncbi:MAG: molybdate ABC transporter substrate-binding protein [Nitratiruptor sp.]|nr:molybdate ABC transporter substrate-binding protein [Nitratiruptor sp.]NPA82886.1 molybdate ABC transporter substrate-binding protein [Campylobacterota bacterium]